MLRLSIFQAALLRNFATLFENEQSQRAGDRCIWRMHDADRGKLYAFRLILRCQHHLGRLDDHGHCRALFQLEPINRP
jgi:hypothetical protein